ncbi:MAG TPA: sigma-70 family RNA polymerase sigma factor [Kofleriaceae bacterium]|nr:sigma-70 family RNA polymerase sigma factor [Kofleriaceae bacterium]
MTEDLDRVLSDLLAAGELDRAATAALEALGPQILGYLAATLRDDDAAYDVFGQFSEEMWKSIRSFRGDSSFKTWAYKIVMHSISRYRRDGYRRRGQPLDSAAISAIAEDVRSRTPRFQQTEVKDRITELRESLDADEQTLLFLRIDQGLSWGDVAQVMSARGEDVEVAALRKRFERAKTKLRVLAEANGILGDRSRS